MPQFNFKSQLEFTRNHLIGQHIRNTSNSEQLRSEEAIRNVIESYMSKLRAADGPLTEAAKHVAESNEIITVQYFNDLFSSVFFDLSALYSELELVDEVMSLNLQRNKYYFLTIKKRIRELEARLQLARNQKFGGTGSESYFESFSNEIGADRTQSIVIDKKNGFLYLEKALSTLLSRSSIIKSVTSTTYPTDNIEDGTIHTTNILNTFEENYKNGPRDMLRNGLWKQELITRGIPKMTVNIGDADNPIRRPYEGIVSIVDINYVYPVTISRFDFDLFGKWPTKVDCVMYKMQDSDDWKFLELASELRDQLFPLEKQNQVVSGEQFDILSVMNVEPVKVSKIRIVFNQRNFEPLENPKISDQSIDEKINADLSERRYEIAKLSKQTDESPLQPQLPENESLYTQIVNIIETNRNIDVIFKKILNILQPSVVATSFDFDTSMKYVLGAWSIEPRKEQYVQSVGIYDSKGYKLNQSPLISTALTTEQSLPEATTCEWYIVSDSLNIPVIENEDHVRKESLHPVNLSAFGDYSDWPGTFAVLNFPIDPNNQEFLEIYENGTRRTAGRFIFLNSRLIYFHDLLDPNKKEYAIRYPAATYDAVNLYTLTKHPNAEVDFNVSLHMVSLRRDFLTAFISQFTTEVDGEQVSIKKYYSIASASATRQEAQRWFGNEFNTVLFISPNMINYFNSVAAPPNNLSTLTSFPGGFWSQIISSSVSKNSLSIDDVNDFFDSSIETVSFDLLGSPGIAPLAGAREVE